MKALRDIFAPFSAFQWTPTPSSVTPTTTTATPTRAPVGIDKKEAEKVAWLVTCAPYVSESQLSRAAEGLKFAIHLQRDGTVADRIYKRLASRTDELVSVKDVENELKCKWGEVDAMLDGRPRRIDPYFWKLVESDVRNSCLEYLRALDESVTMLSGIDPMERSVHVHQTVARMIRAVSHELANNLLNRNTDQTKTVDLLKRLQSHYATEHVNSVKERLRRDMQGYVALNRCAAASADNFDEVLQEGDQHIACLVACPPKEFTDHLMRGGAHIYELSSTFCVNSNGLVSVSSTPPASFGVRATVLARWLHKHKGIVGEACAAQIGVSRRLCSLPPTHPTWTNIELCRNSPDDVRTREAMDAARESRTIRGVAWKPPYHLGDIGDSRILICGAPDCRLAIRACRILEVLLQQAKLGLLPAMTIRASVILPVISRFTVENAFCYASLVDMKLRPVAMTADVPWPDDVRIRNAYSCSRSDNNNHNCNNPTEHDYNRNKRNAPATPYASSSEPGSEDDVDEVVETNPKATTIPAPSLQPTTFRPHVASNATVPLIMQRDYAVLHSLSSLIRARAVASGTRIGLDDICDSTRRLSPFLRDSSQSSLKQVVAHVAKRVVERAAEQCQGGTVAYSGRRDRSADGRVDGIICDGPGTTALLAYVEYSLNRMLHDGARFTREWRVSRSAMSHARSVEKKSSETKRTKSQL